MRTLLVSFVLVACAIFLLGGIAAWAGYIDVMIYALIAGIFGSAASILGLISLGSKTIKTSDVREVESDLLSSLAKTSKQLEEYEGKLNRNKEEVSKFEIQRAEIEMLVRKAGARIFMEEQLKRTSEEIENHVLKTPILHSLLENYTTYKQNVEKINGEIRESPHAELIISIAEDVMAQGRRYYVNILGNRIEISPFVGALDIAARSITKTMIGAR